MIERKKKTYFRNMLRVYNLESLPFDSEQNGAVD